MPLSIERSNDLIKLNLTGLVTAKDLYAGVDALYENGPPARVLWDLTTAEIPDAADMPDQLRDFSSYATEKGKSRKGSKVAVITPQDIQFGMARMSATFAELNRAAYSMQVFRDQPSAMAWLDSDGPALPE